MTKLYKKHLSRLRFVYLAIVVFLSVSAFRSLYIQLLRSQNKNIIHAKKVKGPRGTIYDRNGVRLAYDVKLYDLYINDIDKVDLKKISSFMRNNFDPKYNYDSLLKTSNGYLILKKSILEEKIKAFEYELKQIKGLHAVSYIGRYYPRKNLASQIIGKYSYSSNTNKGLWGIERTLGDIMDGKEGELEVNIRSRGSKQKAYTDSEYRELSGENVILTIDSDYQRILEDELVNRLNKTNSESANGVIIDPYSGEILALASIPTFDLNGKVSNSSIYRDNSTNYEFEPGSTFKIFPILAGLEKNVISLGDKYFISENKEHWIPHLKRKIIDHEQYDTLTVSDILAKSSNIGIAKIANEIGKQSLYNILKDFGIGSKTGINSYKEESGELKPLQDWDEWSLGSIAMGQEMRATSIQVAMVYSAIANGGYILEPKIIKKVSNIEKPISIVRKVSTSEEIEQIVEALEMVVSSGTGYSEYDDFCMFGKTGTAQVWDNEKNEYSKSTYIPSFVGVVPCDNPKLVCVISLYKPDLEYMWASAEAVPAVKNVFRQILIKESYNEIADEFK